MNFIKKKSGKYGVRTICKKCRKGEFRNYYNSYAQKHNEKEIKIFKERYRIHAKKYYIKHKKQFAERSHRYQLLHKKEIKEQRRQFRIKNKEKVLNQKYLHLYKKSLAEIKQIFINQNNKCAICKSNTPNTKHGWGVDHNHTTSQVRGILCGNCNRGLGAFQDNINFLFQAIEYLQNTDNL